MITVKQVCMIKEIKEKYGTSAMADSRVAKSTPGAADEEARTTCEL